MKLSVVIVNYNVKYFLEQVLHSVRQAMGQLAVEVFVVDNNSVDDSVQMVQEKFPWVHLIANEENVGFSRANNQAIKLAKGKYVLLLNPDTLVEEDTFEKTIAFMDNHPKAGGLGVRMIDGKGNFLPESKRGFPSPYVAFCKAFGLSRLFPRSRTFNRYHLGYLDPNENHEVEVLSGAFMLLRKSVLDEIGLLDETFFMYGEDIDLSYRIIKAGYQNYYFSDTTIIHYKGESTKKGSMNYVRVFYNAMIIFARKHFEGERARLYIFMLQLAIYLRAFMTLVSQLGRRLYYPIADAALLFVGMYLLKDFWATYVYGDPNYYPALYMRFNVPLYIGIWLLAIYFSGGYDETNRLRRLIRGLAVGTVLLAAIYGFLDMEYRTSRALIVLGMLWGMLSLSSLRALIHLLRHGHLRMGNRPIKNLVIVGSEEESRRALHLVQQAQVHHNFIGTVSVTRTGDLQKFLGNLSQLDEIVHIYRVSELIFCSKDIPAQDIMAWMTRLGTSIDYKIIPEGALSIIGSNSKNTAGDLYAIDIRFEIAAPMNRRNKRVLDVLLSFGILLASPILVWMVQSKDGLFRNSIHVLLGQKTWVGYYPTEHPTNNLPPLRPAVLNPIDALPVGTVNPPTANRLNFLYAKAYTASRDLEIVWKSVRHLGK